MSLSTKCIIKFEILYQPSIRSTSLPRFLQCKYKKCTNVVLLKEKVLII